VKSYEDFNSSGTVQIFNFDASSVEGKDVIVVEDIVDTGRTISKLLELFKEHNPESMEICSLLKKRLTNHYKDIVAKYTGFSIPNRFVIGYGLDYNEMYRDLPDIWVISEEGIQNGGEEE